MPCVCSCAPPARRYAEFLKERNEMANRDWLSMRDQVGVETHVCAQSFSSRVSAHL